MSPPIHNLFTFVIVYTLPPPVHNLFILILYPL
nr:MAG TPA: hypothetical protein [Caudoviricetes sp.]